MKYFISISILFLLNSCGGYVDPTSSDEEMQKWIDSLRPAIEKQIAYFDDLGELPLPDYKELQLDHEVDFRNYLPKSDPNSRLEINRNRDATIISKKSLKGEELKIGGWDWELWKGYKYQLEPLLEGPYKSDKGNEVANRDWREAIMEQIKSGLQPSYVLVVEVRTLKLPKATSSASFESGFFEGYGHLYKLDGLEYLGSIQFSASNSKDLLYQDDDRDAMESLQETIEQSLYNAIVASLNLKLEQTDKILKH